MKTLADLFPDVPLAPAQAAAGVSGITADSRAVGPGILFAGLPGTKVDGASFAEMAAAAGAVAVLVSDSAVLPADLAVPVIRSADPRQALALAAARFHGPFPARIAAVTGTAGKTSVAAFTRQILSAAGRNAASVGTLGVVTDAGTEYGSLTTPDPVKLAQMLGDLARAGVTDVALEASSHGLDQRRLDGVPVSAVAFTNLGRDHMDYHPTVEDYLAAKLRLFDTLAAPGTPAIIDPDAPFADRVVARALACGLDVRTVGPSGTALTLIADRIEGTGQRLEILTPDGAHHSVLLPLLGAFQVSNALIAAGLAIALGVAPEVAIAALAHIEGAPGRLELVGRTRQGAPVFVDYAHKPDALKTVLETLRPLAAGRLVCVVGCGGDRDRGKRPLMGAIATELADVVIVTDDNPRSEDPAAIRRAILEAAPGAREIGDRATAIHTAVGMLAAGDVLVIAGKGHETGQIVGDRTLPFSDHAAARSALATGDRMTEPLWTFADFLAASDGRLVGLSKRDVTGISIDTRTLKPGDAFFAIKGDTHDGHAFVSDALARGASVAVVGEGTLAGAGSIDRLVVTSDVMEALRNVARAARARSEARIVGVTGSVGKTGTKEALRLALGESGPVHASIASFNNHWGVPLSLARLPKSATFGVFEIGMSAPGEITPLTAMVRPNVAIVTTIAPSHMAFFPDLDAVARAKAEIFTGVTPGGSVVLNRDIPQYELLARMAAEVGIANIVGFGLTEGAEARALSVSLGPDGSEVTAEILGTPVSYHIGAPGQHLVMNSLAVLATAVLTGADLRAAAAALARFVPPGGRGRRVTLGFAEGTALLIDEAYNANPTSMAAALDVLRLAPVGPGGRRIAVLGDMRELGPDSPAMHAGLVPLITAAGVEQVFLVGPEMRALADALPAELLAGHADAATELEPAIRAALRPGDVVMVKASNGTRLGAVVAALAAAFPETGPVPVA